MCRKSNTTSCLKVKDVFSRNDIRAYESESMQEAAARAKYRFQLIPVFNYSGSYVGALNKSDFLRFQSQYFENLKFCDRRNEFLFDSAENSSDIHFIPIDQVSRYVDRTIQPISWAESVDSILDELVNRNLTALPVMDDEQNVVGSVSVIELVRAQKVKSTPPGKQHTENRAFACCCHG